MDKLIFCQGNSKFLLCQGVNFIIDELGITLKTQNPFDKYRLYTERLSTLPRTLAEGRRQQLAEWGYYASGLSRSLRCFWCHSLAKLESIHDITVNPADLHNDKVQCDFLKLAKENAEGENIKCSICEQKYKFGYVILKCGHGVFCYKCMYTASECPFRCGSIKGFARAYITWEMGCLACGDFKAKRPLVMYPRCKHIVCFFCWLATWKCEICESIEEQYVWDLHMWKVRYPRRNYVLQCNSMLLLIPCLCLLLVRHHKHLHFLWPKF